jgi:lipopolysaccharide transport system permease protein
VEVFRCGLLGQGTIVLWALAWSWFFTLITTVFGIMIFNRVEKTFMDTV